MEVPVPLDRIHKLVREQQLEPPRFKTTKVLHNIFVCIVLRFFQNYVSVTGSVFDQVTWPGTGKVSKYLGNWK